MQKEMIVSSNGHETMVAILEDDLLALDEDFRDEVVFENGHHGLVAVGGDDHLLGHSQTPDGRPAVLRYIRGHRDS